MVKRNGSRSQKYQYRSQSGQQIITGTISVFFLLAIAVPIGLFFINVTIQQLIASEIAQIANKAAGTGDARRTWLGQPRPGEQRSNQAQKVEDEARRLCKIVGLQVNKVKVKFDESTDDSEVSLTTAELTVDIQDKIPFRVKVFGNNFATLFPNELTARGVAVHANVRPYALMHLEAPAFNFGDERGSSASRVQANNRETAIVPIYAFGGKVAAGVPDTLTTFLAGGEPQHLNPENFVSFNTYHLRSEDVNALKDSSLKQFTMTGWHPQRKFNDKFISPITQPPQVGLGAGPAVIQAGLAAK